MNEQIEKIFKRLKVLHPLWASGDNDYKKRLEDSLEKDFNTLEGLGVPRHFSEALLFFDKEFVGSLGEKNRQIHDAELIFGVKSKEMSKDDAKAAEIAKRSGITCYKMVKKNGKVGITYNYPSTSTKEAVSQKSLGLKNT